MGSRSCFDDHCRRRAWARPSAGCVAASLCRFDRVVSNVMKASAASPAESGRFNIPARSSGLAHPAEPYLPRRHKRIGSRLPTHSREQALPGETREPGCGARLWQSSRSCSSKRACASLRLSSPPDMIASFVGRCNGATQHPSLHYLGGAMIAIQADF
jgi:hypothetical protein